MKNSFVLGLSVFLCVLLVSASFAEVVIPAGVRSAGMGGCGVAISTGLVSAIYNPAGMVKGGNLEGRLGLGLPSNYNELLTVISDLNDTSKLIEDKFKDSFDVNSTATGIAGISFSKIGLVVVPTAYCLAQKEKNSINANFEGTANITGMLTGGYSFSTPYLPIGSVDVGASLKYVNHGIGWMSSSYVDGDPTGTGASTYLLGNGVGLDLGAKGEINIPMVTKITVGAVIRDMFETINYSGKFKTYEITSTEGTATEVPPSGDITDSIVMPTTVGLGVSATLPGFGTLLTSDMIMVSGSNSEENPAFGQTTMHFGVEQPIMLNVMSIRGGWATGENPYSSLGLGFNMGVGLDLAYIMDGKDSKGNAFEIEVSGSI